jgi:amidohydrolase
MASMDLFTIKLLGKAGHGAMAHEAVDAIIMSGEVLSALQTITSREISPLKSIVIHVGTIHGGFGFNIVADQVELRGTVRALDSNIQKTIPKRMNRILKGITTAIRGHFELDYQFGYPVLINDPGMTELVRKIIAEVVGDKRIVEIEPTMAGEDMAFFLREVPGCFFFVGSANKAKGLSAKHHSPFFDFDEEAMVLGTEIMTKAALNYLRQN